MNYKFIYDILINHKSEWNKALNPKVDKLTGGISNQIYRISSDNIGSILLRIYGEKMDSLINRNQEINIFKFVSDNNISPKLLGLIDNGRFEEYIQAKPLDDKMIITYRTQIITKIKKINSLTYQGDLLCWDRLEKWNQIIKDKNLPDYQNDIDKMLEKFSNLPQDHIFMKQVFCHNDLLPSNILLDNDENIHIIDYEYAGINYLGFEIANHVIYYDFENIKNQETEVYNFVKEYLDRDPTMIDLEIMEFFIKLTYLTWLLWGLISIVSSNDENEYDFNEYVNICFRNYNFY